MNRFFIPTAFVALATAFSAHAKPERYDGEELASQAKVTIQQAEAAALKARPGVVKDKELEKEHGGLRYSFDIESGGKVYEVGIDANSGKVLENKAEGKNPD